MLHPAENCHTGTERVLLRFVFDDVGAPLYLAEDAEQLIAFAHDHLNGTHSKTVFTAPDSDSGLVRVAIWGLSRVDILHQDISFGNLLVTFSEPHRGLLIDLGLATKVDQDGQAVPEEKLDHHITVSLIRFQIYVSCD